MKKLLFQVRVLIYIGVLVLLCAGGAGCSPSTVDGCLNQATEAAVNGKWERALKLARRAVELDPNNIDALVFRAIAYEQNGERDLALDSARQAAELDPDHFAAQYTLGRLYASDPTRSVEAQRALLRALKARPGDADTLVLLANAASWVRSPQMMNYLLMLKKYPEIADSAAWHNQMGMAQLWRRDYPRAKTEFLAACRLDAKSPMAVLNLGRFLDQHSDQKGTADNFYRHFLKLTGDDPQYAAQRSEVERRLNNGR